MLPRGSKNDRTAEHAVYSASNDDSVRTSGWNIKYCRRDCGCECDDLHMDWIQLANGFLLKAALD